MLFKTCRRAKPKRIIIKAIKTENSFGATSPTKVPLPGAFIRAVPLRQFSGCPLSLILELLSLLCMAIVKAPANYPGEGASKNEKMSEGVDSEGKYERWRLTGTGILATCIHSKLRRNLYRVRAILAKITH